MYNPGKHNGGSKSSNTDMISLIEDSLSAKRQQTSFKRINLTTKIVLYNHHYAVFDLTFPKEHAEFVQDGHYYPIRVKNPIDNEAKFTVFTPTEFHTPQREQFQVYCLFNTIKNNNSSRNTNSSNNSNNNNTETSSLKSPTFYIVPTEGYVKCKF